MGDFDQPMPSMMAARTGQMKSLDLRPSSIETRLGARISAVREGMGLTVASVSASTGIEDMRLFQIESGQTRAEATEIYDIAICLRSSISELFLGA